MQYYYLKCSPHSQFPNCPQNGLQSFLVNPRDKVTSHMACLVAPVRYHLGHCSSSFVFHDVAILRNPGPLSWETPP